MKKLKRSTLLRLIIGLIVVAGVIGGIFFSPLRTYLTFDNIIWTVETARLNSWSLPIFYCFFVLAVLGLPLTLFPVVGGVLFGFWLALPLNILACTAGATLAFLLTRFFGREAVERLLKGKWKVFDHIAAVEGVKAVAVLRLLGLPPFLILNYVLGLSSIKLRDYVVGTLIGVMPWMALITFASHALWQAILQGGKKEFTVALFRIMGPISLLSVGIAVTMAVSYKLKKRRKAAHHSNL